MLDRTLRGRPFYKDHAETFHDEVAGELPGCAGHKPAVGYDDLMISGDLQEKMNVVVEPGLGHEADRRRGDGDGRGRLLIDLKRSPSAAGPVAIYRRERIEEAVALQLDDRVDLENVSGERCAQWIDFLVLDRRSSAAVFRPDPPHAAQRQGLAGSLGPVDEVHRRLLRTCVDDLGNDGEADLGRAVRDVEVAVESLAVRYAGRDVHCEARGDG
ncbi:MAG: hypothetical protein ABI647_08990, partial [Gemmatimonadota bacterium]